MNLTIDIGNTCTKLVAFDGTRPVEEVRVDDNEWHKLSSFCQKYAFERGIYSTVVNLSEEKIKQIKSLSFPVIQLLSGVTPVPVNNKYSTPHTLGADRLAAVVGAYSKQPGTNVLVIDVGTCITYDFITSAGDYLGGNISPGPTIRLKSLNEFTDCLPLVKRKGDLPMMGISTETAIRSGVMRGIKYEIEGYIREFSMRYPLLAVYITGGIHVDLDVADVNIIRDNYIVPEGLNMILQYNMK